MMLACVGMCVCEVGWEGYYPRGYTEATLTASFPPTDPVDRAHLYQGPGALQ